MPIAIVSFFAITLITSAFSTTPTPTSGDTSVSVTMSLEGYEPAEVNIAPHTEVIFYNEGTEDFWPATDNHPTHTLYDGTSLEEHCSQANNDSFDACRAIKPGERWSFVFPTSGTFTYHDHLWPHLKGTILVRESDTQTPLSSLTERFISFTDMLLALVKGTFFMGNTANSTTPTLPANPYVRKVVESDPRWAIDALRQDSASSSELFARCHEILHDIGKEAFNQYGSFGAASVFQSDFCNSGYIHGVFEAHFSVTNEPTAGLVEACENYAAVAGRPFDLWQCHHGVGHGFMYFTGGDVVAALKLCRTAFELEKAIGDCRNGVYMELFNGETLAQEVEYLDPREPHAICESILIAQADCYHYLPTFYFQNSQLDPLEIFATCDTITPEFKDACKAGAGAEAMKRSIGKPLTTFFNCGLLTSLRDQTLCVAGAVSMYVNLTASLTESYRMCETIPEIYRRACRMVVDDRANDFINQ